MAIETKTFESVDNSLDMSEFQSEFKWLLWDVAKNADVKQANHFVGNAVKKEKLTNTDACFLCSTIDKMLDNGKINMLSMAQQNFARTIANNSRWEWIEEMYNSGEKKAEIKNLFENMTKIA